MERTQRTLSQHRTKIMLNKETHRISCLDKETEIEKYIQL